MAGRTYPYVHTHGDVRTFNRKDIMLVCKKRAGLDYEMYVPVKLKLFSLNTILH